MRLSLSAQIVISSAMVLGVASAPAQSTLSPDAAAGIRRRAVVPSAPQLLATGTIGTAGGSLSGGGLSVVIPGGTLTSTTSLTIRRWPDIRGFGDASDTFVIGGLPSKLSGPLTLRLDVSGAPAGGEKCYVEVEAAMFAKSLPAESSWNTRMVPVQAELSGSRAAVTLPASWPLPGSAKSPTASPVESLADANAGDLRVKATYYSVIESEHFRTVGDANDLAGARAVLDAFERHYQRIVDLGFSFGCRQGSEGFRRIGVQIVSSSNLGAHVSGSDPCGTNWLFATDYIEIGNSAPISDPRVNGAAAHELFHLVQDMYSPGGASANLWLKEATSVWIENLLSVPCDVQSAYVNFPWNGLFNSRNSAVTGWWTVDRERHHGYGAANFLTYHSDKSPVVNDPFVASIWKSIAGGGTEVGAVENALGSSLAAYWKQYGHDYFAGAGAKACFVNYANFARETVSAASDVPRSTSFDGYPLSARGWVLDLQKFSAPGAVPVTVVARGLLANQSVYVYDVKDKKDLAELTESSNSFQIDDLNKLAGHVLVLIFVDGNVPYATSANSASATNRVNLAFGDDQYRCWAKVLVAGYEESYGGGTAVCLANCWLYDGSPSSNFIGSFTGDRFKATTMWCPDPPSSCGWRDDGAAYTNLMQFDLVSRAAFIEGFSLRTSLTNKRGGPFTSSVTVTAQVPQAAASSAGFQYRLTGNEVCSSVTVGGTSAPAVKNVSCNASSYFLLSCEAYTPPSK